MEKYTNSADTTDYTEMKTKDTKKAELEKTDFYRISVLAIEREADVLFDIYNYF